MGDQGAGGGIESHMPTHRRQDSGEEPIPTESVPETRNPPPEPDQQEQYSQTLQELPRGSRELVEDGAGAAAPVVVGAAPGLSRNPSTCSTSSHAKPNSEYLTAHTSERRPSPLSRSSTIVSNRPLEPPVTKATLSELDVNKIIHNPKLRHDINFDPELHFRPNLDGEKGRKKQEKANQFWNALLDQLMQFVTDRDGFHRSYGKDEDWCLPLLLRAVKEIIQTLVPQRDREFLNEGLNVDLLMQQFNRGVADLERLASWLSGVLKLHCAPMRDEWVDEMYNELSSGNRNNDMAELVKGMRSLLSVLEAMKLDVANHQIRCLRPVLIEDTVHFEQRFFMKKIQARKVDIREARIWYRGARECAERSYMGSAMPYLHAFGETAVFFEALSRLVLPSTDTTKVPTTFLFDEERIIKLRSDMYDNICLEICMRKYEDLERLSKLTQLYSRVPAYVRESSTSSGRSSAEFNFNAPTTTSRPSSLALSDHGSINSSPRNSGGLFAQPILDLAESRSRSANLYSSLVALLHTAAPSSRPAQRWQCLAQSVAPQILRYVNAPHSLPGFEDQLVECLGDVQNEVFREVELQFQQRLLGALAKRVKDYKSLSGVGLFSVATGGRVNGSSRDREQRDVSLFASLDSRPLDPREDAGIEDMATRLAHLGILHWRVWSQLAYEGDVNMDLGGSPQMTGI
ncbi:T-complex protein 11-domain-containing protein [Lasiosphaeria ovina]|uniref:T-complex protein 11-domain-containing protein n=1 Tax=Lasiosphaeria ovina TaxID=92902 RepID=A0AAE0N639_9PEZI|nr:T-complex protein 11-domain-containing protein [Lasiosphaeria ovina]